MGIRNAASSDSVWRGLDYCNQGKVMSYEKIDDYRYIGYVSGSNDEIYHVLMDVKHPRFSVRKPRGGK